MVILYFLVNQSVFAKAKHLPLVEQNLNDCKFLTFFYFTLYFGESYAL